MARAGEAFPGQRHTGDDEDDPEGEEGEVPAERRAEVVADVVNAEKLVVDKAFDDVEDPPAGEQHPEMSAPRRRQLAALPRTEHQAPWS